MLRSVFTSLAVASVILSAPLAQASTQQIKTADLDLSTAEGQAKLDSRIMRAARSACARNNTATRINRSSDDECVARAAASAREALAAQVPVSNRGG